jgi:hypothetical protein
VSDSESRCRELVADSRIQIWIVVGSGFQFWVIWTEQDWQKLIVNDVLPFGIQDSFGFLKLYSRF